MKKRNKKTRKPVKKARKKPGFVVWSSGDGNHFRGEVVPGPVNIGPDLYALLREIASWEDGKTETRFRKL